MTEKLFLRRGEVTEILGISEETMTKLVQAGTLTPRYLVDGGRAYFMRTDVLKLTNRDAAERAANQTKGK